MGVGKDVEEVADTGFEFRGRSLECGVRGAVRCALERRVGHAPVHHLRVRRKLRTHLTHTIAERDHCVETLAGDLVNLGTTSSVDINAAALHHAYRVGM